MIQSSAWLMLAAGDHRQYGGNVGYDDDPGTHYSWDSTVANHADVVVGDPIALWDKETLLGASVIEEIERGVDEKVLRRCSNCKRATIKERTTLIPRYRCYTCLSKFEVPSTVTKEVTTYRSRHDGAWVDLESLIDGKKLRQLCKSPTSQLSIRPLKWKEFVGEVAVRGGPSRLLQRGASVDGDPPTGGHTDVLVRVRRGQRAFRGRLLARYGPVCALTGSAPESALEAAHLYSYATLGHHDTHGGLLLRRDVHRLFDQGALAVHPGTAQIHAEEWLHDYPNYADLHGRSVYVSLVPTQEKWLQHHWKLHREE